MALKVKLALEKASQGERLDRYYAQEGDWFFEVHVPKGERPTSANVEFEFEDVYSAECGLLKSENQ